MLRLWTGGPGACEVRIGTFCYWNNNGDDLPREERPAVGAERDRLLATLAGAAAVAPADPWIAGQRVRYLLDAGRPDSALAVARSCGAGLAWCGALRGLVLHVAERDPAAVAAFDSARAAMPTEARCRWDDPSLWLEARGREQWKGAACGTPAQARLATRLWTLAAPLLTRGPDDLRAEWNARQVMAQIHRESATAYGTPWNDAADEIERRFGWPIAWSLADIPVDSVRGPWNVTGHEPIPSFAFIPADGALATALTGSVSALPADAWSLYAAGVRTRYAPRYLRGGLFGLESRQAAQVARFRRGDTSVVAASWSLGRDTSGFAGIARWQEAPLAGSLLLLDDSLRTVARVDRPGAPVRGALLVREARATGGRPACTASSCAPIGCVARLVLGGGSSPSPPTRRSPTSCSSLPASLPTPGSRPWRRPCMARLPSVPAPQWGFTGNSTAPVRRHRATPSRYRPRGSPARPGEKFKSKLGFDVIQQPVRVKVVDRGRPDGHPGRALTIAWPDVPTGDYRLEITRAAPTGAVTTALVVRLEGQ
jgi:hypothetical protein